jgi:hypothetical protein
MRKARSPGASWLVCVATALASAGCFYRSELPDGRTYYSSIKKMQRRTVLQRASKDFQCPLDGITMTRPCFSKVFVVEVCGRRVQYRCDRHYPGEFDVEFDCRPL